jgi:hypothetical protein
MASPCPITFVAEPARLQSAVAANATRDDSHRQKIVNMPATNTSR